MRHRLDLATRTQISVCKSPFPSAGTAVSLCTNVQPTNFILFYVAQYLHLDSKGLNCCFVLFITGLSGTVSRLRGERQEVTQRPGDDKLTRGDDLGD